MKRLNGGQGLVEYGLIFGLICVVALAAMGASGERSISDGSKTGIVTGFEYSGVKWKTYEGDLLLGGGSGQGALTSTHWKFTVPDKKVAEEVMKAMKHREMVELGYHETFFAWPSEGETRHFVSSVRRMTETSASEGR